MRRRDVQQRQERVDRVGPPLARHVWIFQQRLQLGPEDDAAAGHLGVVERLDAEAVARQHQTPRVRVPQREREHAAEAVHAAFSPLLVAVDDDLRVGAGPEAMAGRRQLRAHLGEVVDLAVEHDPHGAVFVGQRLIAG